ncbi:hypothetical protein AVEN_171387-1 [Araneus ventricosus]|uniref:Uncharacterized protein n=1 Tax=Araneus ventricosus TaxID=182803 RepID=A0A4Y2FF79_ARAVE|nr:hypothetical protein AVEN_171387-1 [Araneus ventricosus]
MSSQSAAVEIQTTALPEGHHEEVGYQSPSKAVPYMPMTTLLDSPGRTLKGNWPTFVRGAGEPGEPRAASPAESRFPQQSTYQFEELRRSATGGARRVRW